MKKKKKLSDIELLDKVLGNAQRDLYLEDNPHGYSRVNSKSKNKKKYNRKLEKGNHGINHDYPSFFRPFEGYYLTKLSPKAYSHQVSSFLVVSM